MGAQEDLELAARIAHEKPLGALAEKCSRHTRPLCVPKTPSGLIR